MIEFYQYSHDKVQIDIEEGDVSSYSVVVDVREFEDALDTLLDGHFLSNWLKETMKEIAEQCCDCGTICDDELELFKGILEEIL